MTAGDIDPPGIDPPESQAPVGPGDSEDDGGIMSPAFFLMGATAGMFWLGITSTIPVLPRFIRDELGGGDVMVGAIIGSLAIGAIVARPRLGRLGDTHGRRLLMAGGGLVAALATIAHVAVEAQAPMFALRILLGIGQAAFMVGVTTMALDLAPPERRGEATAYTLVAMHFGIGSGPLLGEWVFNTWSFDAVWLVSAAVFGLSGAIATLLPVMPPSADLPPSERKRFLHPAGLMPGVVLGVGVMGYVGYSAFVPLFGEEIGIDNVAPLFLVSSITIVLIRFFGARLPDQLGPVRGGSIALVLMSIGLLVIGIWETVPGLYFGAVVMAIGSALLFPSLVSAAVDGVPVTERASAMATFTLFIDLSSALGVVVFGAISAGTSYSAAFIIGGVLTALALVILLSPAFPRATTPAAP